MRAALVLVVLLGACSGASNFGGPDASGYGDAPNGCSVSLVYDPVPAITGMMVNVTAHLSSAGLPAWQWHLYAPDGTELGLSFETGDRSRVGFTPMVSGAYFVTADPQLGEPCAQGQQHIQVQAPGAGSASYYVRVVAPSAVAPPQARLVQVLSGTPLDQTFALDPGISVTGSVVASGGVPAYVRFTPSDGTGAFVETFSDGSGNFTVRLLGVSYDALVVPEQPGLAPRVFAGWSPITHPPLALTAGTAVSGTVKDPGGAALAGATVQLQSGELPSTLATTDASGAFTVHEAFGAGPVSVVVTPPPGRGLPTLTASTTFDLTRPMQIQYAAALATCDLAGAHVQRAGAGVANAKVAIVGTVMSAGTVTTGGTTAQAAGAVHATATTGAGGALPSTLVPRAQLAAVIEIAADHAVAAVDAAACAAPTLDAPPSIAQTGTVLDASAAHGVAGAQLEATPVAGTALALAGAPAVAATAAADGTFSLPLAAGASYELRIADPAAKSAARTFPPLAPSTTPIMEVLDPAVALTGTVTASGNPQPGAAVQVLCATCTGLEASRPVAAASTDATGRFALAVPEPGSM